MTFNAQMTEVCKTEKSNSDYTRRYNQREE